MVVWHSPVDPEDPHRDDAPATAWHDVLAAVALLLLVWCAVLGAKALTHEAKVEAGITGSALAR